MTPTFNPDDPMEQFAFDINEELPETGGDFTPLPDGEYKLLIHSVKLKPTRTGGQMARIQYAVCDGQPYANRRVFVNYNIVNRSEVAQAIGRRQLQDVCKAIGLDGTLTSLDPLTDKVLIARLATEPGKGQYGPQNVVKSVRPASGSAPEAPKPQAAPPSVGDPVGLSDEEVPF